MCKKTPAYEEEISLVYNKFSPKIRKYLIRMGLSFVGSRTTRYEHNQNKKSPCVYNFTGSGKFYSLTHKELLKMASNNR